MTQIPEGFGIGIPWQRAENDPDWYRFALNWFQPPWWYNWKYDQLGRSGYVPMVWKCNSDSITAAATKMDGQQLWLLGNEPERRDQSNTTPNDFAAAVRQAVRPYAIPGVLWNWQGEGKAWINEYIAAGGPLPDAWHIHIYAYTATEWSEYLQESLKYLRHLADKPVIISETAAWASDSNPEIMDLTREVVMGGLVTAAWFSTYYDRWEDPNLLTEEGSLTRLGRRYIQRQLHLPVILG